MGDEVRTRQADAETGSSLRDRVIQRIRDMIAEGEIRPGERLLEAEIVRAFSVSRSPARQALDALQKEGLVEALPGRGYRVCGRRENGVETAFAALAPVDMSAPRQWERMYEEVEQELFIRTLFASVRVSEQRLAEHFGVSRTVTRDLLARMHGVGLVGKDNAGHWIAEKMTPDRIRHLYELRCILEPPALREAGPLVPRALLDEMRARIFATRAENPISSAKFDEVETDLHFTILDFGQNKEIMRALKRTHLLFGPTRYLFDPVLGIPMDLIGAALDEHLEIVDLMLEERSDLAAQVLEAHLKNAVERWLRRFEITAAAQPFALPSYLQPLSD
ncbi:MAG: GntR family transcriptional regulator [Pseudomonadota bacterium]